MNKTPLTAALAQHAALEYGTEEGNLAAAHYKNLRDAQTDADAFSDAAAAFLDLRGAPAISGQIADFIREGLDALQYDSFAKPLEPEFDPRAIRNLDLLRRTQRSIGLSGRGRPASWTPHHLNEVNERLAAYCDYPSDEVRFDHPTLEKGQSISWALDHSLWFSRTAEGTDYWEQVYQDLATFERSQEEGAPEPEVEPEPEPEYRLDARGAGMAASVAQAIGNHFAWDGTEEGRNYWYEVMQNLQNLSGSAAPDEEFGERNPTASSRLMRSFNWERTPQGDGYWGDVYSALRRVQETGSYDTENKHLGPLWDSL